MSTKHAIALAVTLLLGSSSIAFAQLGEWSRGTGDDSNAANRFPLLVEPGTYGYPPGTGGGVAMLLPRRPTQQTYQSSQVGLTTAPVALTQRPVVRRAIAGGGPYREDAIALGMARLYGSSRSGAY